MSKSMIILGTILEGSWRITEKIPINKKYSHYKLVNIYAPDKTCIISETQLRKIIKGKNTLSRFIHYKLRRQLGHYGRNKFGRIY